MKVSLGKATPNTDFSVLVDLSFQKSRYEARFRALEGYLVSWKSRIMVQDWVKGVVEMGKKFYYTKSKCDMNVFVARPGCSPQNKLAVHCCHHFFPPPPLSLHDRKDDVLSSYQAARPFREQFFNYVLDSRPAAVKVATCADRNGKK